MSSPIVLEADLSTIAKRLELQFNTDLTTWWLSKRVISDK